MQRNRPEVDQADPSLSFRSHQVGAAGPVEAGQDGGGSQVTTGRFSQSDTGANTLSDCFRTSAAGTSENPPEQTETEALVGESNAPSAQSAPETETAASGHTHTHTHSQSKR